ncbi:MAG: PKD domain-containing protein, partial [bacterium]
MKRPISLCIIALFLIWAFGCSKSMPNPVTPSGETENPSSNIPAMTGAVANPANSDYGHSLLGYWDVLVNPDGPSVEFVPLRTSEMHLNAIKFLEGAQMNISLGAKPVNDNGTLYVQIVLKHPFTGALQFCGFDVKGIFLSLGSETGFGDSELKIAGVHETRLINADGFTRWWNPAEFMGSGIFGYLPGKLGYPLDPTKAAKLNGYKLFADGLAADAGLDTLDVPDRAMFTAGATLSRDYVISLAGGVKFNYAVDASWAPPSPNPPNNVPDDFPIQANAEEPWWFEVTETLNTLWYANSKHGGNAFYDVTIHDWQGSDTIGSVTFESPGLFSIVAADPDSTTADTASYHFEAVLPALKSADPIDVLISVDCPGFYQPSQTGVDKPLKGYYRHLTPVSNVDPVFNTPPFALMHATTPTDILLDESVSFDATESYDPDGAITEYLWDFNGNGIFGEEPYSGDEKTPTYTYTKTGVYNVKLKVRDNSGTSTISDPVAVSVTITSNDPPVALAHATSSTNINQGGSVNFDGTESYDLDGTVVDWQWDFNGDGFFGDPYTGNMETPNAAFPLAGVFYVNLKVVDDGGGSDTLDTKIKVTVSDLPNSDPVAVAVTDDPTDINDCGAIAFNGSASYDTDGFIAKYEWDFNGDGTYGDPYNSGSDDNPTKIFLKSGVYNVSLKVTDNEDATDILDEPISVTVTNVGPIADAIATTSIDIGACDSVSFDATASNDPDCTDIAKFEWDFDGDG